MVDAIGDLLPRKRFEEPEEVRIIKKFVFDKFGQTPGVTIQKNQIIITVRGAALAGALRPRLIELKGLLPQEARLVLRIR